MGTAASQLPALFWGSDMKAALMGAQGTGKTTLSTKVASLMARTGRSGIRPKFETFY